MATEIEEKHCACVYPCAYVSLTRVNILVLMLASYLGTSVNELQTSFILLFSYSIKEILLQSSTNGFQARLKSRNYYASAFTVLAILYNPTGFLSFFLLF